MNILIDSRPSPDHAPHARSPLADFGTLGILGPPSALTTDLMMSVEFAGFQIEMGELEAKKTRLRI
jgi:hypothetical protein